MGGPLIKNKLFAFGAVEASEKTNPIATLPIDEGVEVSSLWIATVISIASAVVIFRNV